MPRSMTGAIKAKQKARAETDLCGLMPQYQIHHASPPNPEEPDDDTQQIARPLLQLPKSGP